MYSNVEKKKKIHKLLAADLMFKWVPLLINKSRIMTKPNKNIDGTKYSGYK